MRDEATTRVVEIHLSQPISVAVQLCLVNLLASWDIFPAAVTSHSSGEIAAAYATEVLSFKEALGVAYYRGELALKHQKLHSLAGGMLAAAIGPESAGMYINDTSGGRVVVACVNSPSSITLSGDLAALDEVASRLEKDGIFARKLKVPMAYHSHHMSHMSQEYIDQLQAILPMPKKAWGDAAMFVSPVTGDKITSPYTLAPEHWARNMTHPVLFSQAFDNMCFREGSLNVDMVVEIGAHSTLAGPIRQILKARNVELPYVSCLKRPVDAVETMQDVACALISRGYPVNLKAVNSPFEVEGQLVGSAFVTDLPTYPWNHSKRFWVEPRISRDQRYKKFPPHELLGTPVNGGNALMPTWRNFIRLSEIEWLKDHQIDGSVVFPGAGYITSAIEAVRLLTDPSEATIQGYKLRDIDIMNAMVIPDSAFGLETQLSLHRCSDKQLDHGGWYEFRLCSLASGGSWIEHCTGFVTADTNDGSKARTAELTRKVEAPRDDTYLQQGIGGAEDTAVTKVDIEALFRGLRERGIYHGPVFQNLIDSHAAGHRAITNFAVAEVACAEHDYVLHPTTLDSVLQASFSSLPKEMDKDTMVLPRSIRSLTVPRSLKRQGGDKLRAFSELVQVDKHGYTSNISIAAAIPDPEDGNSTFPNFLQMQGFFGQAVPRRTDDTNQEAGICSKSCWELDILHNVPADLRASLAIPLEEHEVETERKLVRASYHFICDAMSELQGQNPEVWEWHHKRMYDWMKTVVQQGYDGKLGPGSRSWPKTSKGLKTMLADELNAQNAAGRLTVRVGRKLAAIIRGEVTPLELMMEGNLLNQFYMDHEALKTRSYKHLSTLAELYAIKNPGANVLEIGAGTGGATTTVLEGFGTRGDGTGSILGHYTFTDISPGFFEAARSKFAAWSSLMDFKKLDIEVNPLEQGFTTGAYDLIVAASCLHATKNLNTTMSHVRKLLKPGGTLLLIEATADRLEGQLIFGTLPGWWFGEEPERQMSPNAPLEMWKRVLLETGFTGVDFDVPDYEEPDFQSARVMLSRASTTVQCPFSIVLPPSQQPSGGPGKRPEREAWLRDVSNAITSLTGKSPAIVSLENVEAWQDTVCIFTAEMEGPFVDGMDATTFDQLKKLLNHSSGLLWLSCGGLIDATEPSFGATDGLIRTMRQEDAGKRWIRLDFENNTKPWSSDKIRHIVHVLQQSFDATLDPADVEWEYAVKDSMLQVPRTYPDKTQDALARNVPVDPPPELQLFHQQGRPLVWETPKLGATGINPYFVDNAEISTTDVPSGMVEVEAKAFGLNFREVMVALGELDEPLKGHECAGIITALGPNTEASGLKVGDRVCALVRGRLASRGRTWWTSVAKLPDDMNISWEQAASFPAAYVTAYGSLMQIARLQKGESVLVHAASGGTGQAAVIMAQSVGAEVYATCSTKAKRDLLVQTYGISPDHIFSSRDASFAPAIMAETNGKGVDVVLNSLSGPLLKATWDCVARFGRLVDITKVDIEANRDLQTAPFGRCAVYTSFDLLQLTEYRGRLTHEALVECVRIVRERHGAPVHPITPFSITDMATAMRQMQGGAHMGKLVLVPNPGDKVNVSVTLIDSLEIE
jgi:NADPH:quinone reductase-like Zn-dependent oxidoreductase/SAM-dependent methyltransferase